MTIHQLDQTTTDSQSPFRRGRELGRLHAGRIRQAVAEYERLLLFRGMSQQQVSSTSHELSNFCREWAPEVTDEMIGIGEGAGVPTDSIVMLNSRTEMLAKAGPTGPDECSTAVQVSGDGSPPRTVQTWDWLEELSQDLLVRSFFNDVGTQVTTFAEFGQVAKIGVNDKGLGLHFNILYHESDGSSSGVPIHVVARRVLDRAHTVTDAIEICRSVPVCASTVLTVVAGPDAACIELSPIGVAVVGARQNEPLIHTNHFLDPALSRGERRPSISTSKDRYSCLAERAPRALDLASSFQRVSTLAEGEPPICVTGNPRDSWDIRYATRATITLDIENTALHYCEGSPSDATEDTWRVFPAS